MSVGKSGAQAVHAAMMSAYTLSEDGKTDWLGAAHRTVLIMEARDQQHIENIQDYLEEREVKTFSIIDEGLNEVDPHTLTALATEILDKEDPNTDEIMSTFKLYKDTVRVILELDK